MNIVTYCFVIIMYATRILHHLIQYFKIKNLCVITNFSFSADAYVFLTFPRTFFFILKRKIILLVDVTVEVNSCLEIINSLMIKDQPPHQTWDSRMKSVSQNWEMERQKIFSFTLHSFTKFDGLCSLCNQRSAVVKCNDCTQYKYQCNLCDIGYHFGNLFHDRETWHDGCYVPLGVSECLDDGNNIVKKSLCYVVFLFLHYILCLL